MNYKRLATDADFEELYATGNVAQEIARLENFLRDISHTDPDEQMRAKAILYGMRRVQDYVFQGAQAEENPPQVAPDEPKPRRRWAEMLLPHFGLG